MKTPGAPLIGFTSVPNGRATLRELWLARHLISQLIRRDLTVRYRQTWLGWFWALLNPALSLAMYYSVFGIMIHMTSTEYPVPYSLVLLGGLVLWMLFASTTNAVSETLLNNLHLVQKIWFPRTTLTLAGMGVSLVDFALALTLLGLLLPLAGYPWLLSRLPLLLLCGALTALTGWGLGSVLAVLRLRFRDIRHLIPLLIQGMFYLTPVVWAPGLLSPHGQKFLVFNPLAGLMGLFRYALLGGTLPSSAMIITAIVGPLSVAMAGGLLFHYYEASVVDRE